MIVQKKIKLPGELFMEAQEKLDVLSEKINIDIIILCVTVIMLVFLIHCVHNTLFNKVFNNVKVTYNH